MQTSKRYQREDSNPGSPDCESDILPLSSTYTTVESLTVIEANCKLTRGYNYSEVNDMWQTTLFRT